MAWTESAHNECQAPSAKWRAHAAGPAERAVDILIVRSRSVPPFIRPKLPKGKTYPYQNTVYLAPGISNIALCAEECQIISSGAVRWEPGGETSVVHRCNSKRGINGRLRSA